MLDLEKKKIIIKEEEIFRKEANIKERSLYFVRYSLHDSIEYDAFLNVTDNGIDVFKISNPFKIFSVKLKEMKSQKPLYTLSKCIDGYNILGHELLRLLNFCVECSNDRAGSDIAFSGDLEYLYTMLGTSLNMLTKLLSSKEYNMLDVLMVENSFLVFDIITVDPITAMDNPVYKQYYDKHSKDFIISSNFNFIIRRVSNLDGIISIQPKHNCSSTIQLTS